MARIDHLNHRPDEEGVKKIERLRKAVIDLETLIDEVGADPRSTATAKTYLETCRMWAVKSVVMQYPTDEIE